MTSLYEETIKCWGLQAQVGVAIEECAELIATLNRFFFRKRVDITEMASEIADVEIVCSQLRYIVGSDLVNRQKIKKLKRLRKRVGLAKEETSGN